jgi:environmental stress-induced protein Ves
VDLRPFEVAACAASAWRNGQGRTRELALGPEGATVSAFDWRVTVADIEPGAMSFSRFPGIERVLVATGPGLRLGPAGCTGAAMREIEPWQPLRLDGDEPVDARLVGAPIRVFNAMGRRGAAGVAAAVHRADATLPDARAAVLWCVRGAATLATADGRRTALEEGRAVVVEGPVAIRFAAPADPAGDGALVLSATVHDRP